MNLELALGNVLAYCVQIGLLVGLAACIPALLRLSVPRVRLAFWHALLAACLLLPLLAPWRRQVVTAGVPVTPPRIARTIPVAPLPSRTIPWNQIALALLCAGAGVRLAGLCAGLWRLGQYRRRSLPLQPPASWGVEADLRISDDVASPVTFGAAHPVVLLPANFCELPGATQEAILCHEILHVRRKDWLVTLGEEFIRSAFWFHPAIWWLLGEIALAREQAVDREAIEMTRSREEYVDALLAIAGAIPRLDLAPAPLFLRKRHLKQRVVSILKEARMSKTRSISALAAGLGILAAACWLVTMTFPLSAAPQTVADGMGVTVDLSNAGIMHRTSVMYPDAARRAHIQGTVIVEASLDSSGNVVDARVQSGPLELRRAALQSVLQWHFANDTGANTRQVRITFQEPEVSSGQVAARTPNGGELRAALTTAPGAAMRNGDFAVPALAGKTLKRVMVLGLTDDAKSRLLARIPVHEGDVLAADSVTRTMQAVHEYDEHMSVGTTRDKDGDVSLVISAPGATPQSVMTSSPLPAMPPPPDGERRIRIGGNIQSAKLVSQPRPAYPPLAKQARIMGTVKLAALIGSDGTVRNLTVISGHPLLVASALEAVRQWVYQKTLLNGEPVEVETQIDVNYTLSDEPPQQ